MNLVMDPRVLRILDANFNRAREALRVMEEYARFVLEDRALTAELKAVRHELAGAAGELGRQGLVEGSGLLAARDARDDVGVGSPLASELARVDAAHAVVAAGKRLGEALRVLEEYGKTIHLPFASSMERLRYRSYEVERWLGMARRAWERFGGVRLYVIITEVLCKRNWLKTAREAIAGGADAIQLREKDLSDAEFLLRARELSRLCREFGRLFIVNDRPDIAVAAGAHGVHVGQEDLPVSAVRRLIPPDMLVGLSTHTPAQVDSGMRAGPDYLAVGPMFASDTKRQTEIAGPALVAYATEATSLPVVAIGGINESNAGEVLSAARRAVCLCVCSAVIATDDARRAAAQFASIAR